ncbi:hypothetical protein FH972_022943 [Carpinus fangiana]|uniref:ferroxidase n=1 Tax=Carpinus fangiana TaxID=176857 RepID=A0A5N6KUD6_9ROSI|nr:hypothetical protein FH972_022943 [Carpinus fangiana]
MNMERCTARLLSHALATSKASIRPSASAIRPSTNFARATRANFVRTCTLQRHFHGTPRSAIEILDPASQPTTASQTAKTRPQQPSPQTDEEYAERSELFLEDLVDRLEDLAEQRADIEVEYSAGVLNCRLGDGRTYVLNKQPPNKQIWLSSPVSGPKRYDWVVEGEGMNEKQGSGRGSWIYLRDGSSLTELLKEELEVTVDAEGSQG